MRRVALSPITLAFVLLLTVVGRQQAFMQTPTPPARRCRRRLRRRRFRSISSRCRTASKSRLWAATPLLRNPTNIDIDKDGRIWVAEGVRYRSHHARQPEGDRIVVLEDTDGDGKADSTHTFVQEPGADRAARRLGHRQQDHRRAAARPDRLHGRRSEPALRSGGGQARSAADRLPGHQSRSLAALGHGRSGRQVGVQLRQHGRDVHRPVGQDVPHLQRLSTRSGRSVQVSARSGARMPASPATTVMCTSAGFTARMNADGTNVEIIGHNYRNSYEQSVTSLGDVFQNDNDDPPACRVSWVMEYANFGFSSNDGQRTLAGGSAARAVDSGRGVAPGRSGHDAGRRRVRRRVADRERLLRERRARRRVGRDVLRGRGGRNEIFSYQPARQGAGFALERKIFMTSNVKQQYAGIGLRHGDRRRHPRHRHALPAVGHRGRSRRRAVRQRLDRRARRRAPGSGRHAVRRDLPHRAEGIRVRTSRASTPRRSTV